ncbi:fluoride efflux transporter FluC [Alkalicoccus luteus]|uniref:Fluoride-specific ion channel FluC n=1 Tax=Alkalicoccus luteus TaxID=1237094 RepID=A0A969TXT8_9BACI|nr:CrcB family protein [Alkalicoccus luteus]NJP38514.1 CrcB family protein [Alkalicoccus luteus]
MHPVILLAVFIGGMTGAASRFWINLAFLETGYPFGTIIENISGSLLLGALTAWTLLKPLPAWLKAGLGAGFCGSFTTMATLASDTVLTAGLSETAPIIYLAVSIFGGLAAAALGFFGTYYATKRKEETA